MQQESAAVLCITDTEKVSDAIDEAALICQRDCFQQHLNARMHHVTSSKAIKRNTLCLEVCAMQARSRHTNPIFTWLLSRTSINYVHVVSSTHHRFSAKCEVLGVCI